MKHFLLSLGALCLGLLASPVLANAQDPEFTFIIYDDTGTATTSALNVGDVFHIQALISNPDGINITASQLDLSFDTNALEVVDTAITQGSVMTFGGIDTGSTASDFGTKDASTITDTAGANSSGFITIPQADAGLTATSIKVAGITFQVSSAITTSTLIEVESSSSILDDGASNAGVQLEIYPSSAAYAGSDSPTEPTEVSVVPDLTPELSNLSVADVVTGEIATATFDLAVEDNVIVRLYSGSSCSGSALTSGTFDIGTNLGLSFSTTSLPIGENDVIICSQGGVNDGNSLTTTFTINSTPAPIIDATLAPTSITVGDTGTAELTFGVTVEGGDYTVDAGNSCDVGALTSGTFTLGDADVVVELEADLSALAVGSYEYTLCITGDTNGEQSTETFTLTVNEVPVVTTSSSSSGGGGGSSGGSRAAVLESYSNDTGESQLGSKVVANSGSADSSGGLYAAAPEQEETAEANEASTDAGAAEQSDELDGLHSAAPESCAAVQNLRATADADSQKIVLSWDISIADAAQIDEVIARWGLAGEQMQQISLSPRITSLRLSSANYVGQPVELEVITSGEGCEANTASASVLVPMPIQVDDEAEEENFFANLLSSDQKSTPDSLAQSGPALLALASAAFAGGFALRSHLRSGNSRRRS